MPERIQMIDSFRAEWRDEEASRSVWVFGEVDYATVGRLREALQSEHPRLVVDLSQVTFIDLGGLGCLLEAADRTEAVVLITSPRVDRLLELTDTRHLFETE